MPDIYLVSESSTKHWDIIDGYYRTCSYRLANAGDADGTATVKIYSDYKGLLRTKNDSVPADSVKNFTTTANTCAEDNYIYYRITNVTKSGSYYDGYYANVTYSIENPSGSAKTARIRITAANGTILKNEYIDVPAYRMISKTEQFVLNQRTTVNTEITTYTSM